MKRIIYVSVALLLLVPSYLGAGFIHSHLMETLKNKSENDIIPVIVYVR